MLGSPKPQRQDDLNQTDVGKLKVLIQNIDYALLYIAIVQFVTETCKTNLLE